MSSEPTLGEVARRIDDLVRQVADLVQQLRTDYVRSELYNANRESDQKDVKELRERLDKAEEQAAANRRLFLTTLIGPVLVGLIMLYFAAKFGGPA